MFHGIVLGRTEFHHRRRMSGVADRAKGTEIGGMWSRANLKPNERVGWSRARDGWSGVMKHPNLSHLPLSSHSALSTVQSLSYRTKTLTIIPIHTASYVLQEVPHVTLTRDPRNSPHMTINS